MIVLSLVVAVLAIARLTRLLVTDEITVGYRRWVVNRWGTGSKISYLVHCKWCTSLWLAPLSIPAIVWPNRWALAVYAVPAISYLVGLLARLEE